MGTLGSLPAEALSPAHRSVPLRRVSGKLAASSKPLGVWLTDAGYQVTSVAIMAVVPGMWP